MLVGARAGRLGLRAALLASFTSIGQTRRPWSEALWRQRAAQRPARLAPAAPPPFTAPQNVKMWFAVAGVVAGIILLMVMFMCGITFSKC